jgi:hypothetical protein
MVYRLQRKRVGDRSGGGPKGQGDLSDHLSQKFGTSEFF